MSEMDTGTSLVERAREAVRFACGELAAWEERLAEADELLRALAAERDALRDALRDVASFLPDLNGAEHYLRRISDMRPAMEHAAMFAAASVAVKEEEEA